MRAFLCSFERFLETFLFTLCVFFCIQSNVRLIVSATSSLGTKTFLHFPHLPPLNGKVSCTLLEVPWYGKIPLIKQVVGREGDRLFYDTQGTLWVGSKRIGIPHRKDSAGKSLTPIAPQIIPKGYVFVYAPHDLSFDSRYAELGLVPLSSLKGWVLPLGAIHG